MPDFVTDLLEQFHQRTPIRAGSLIVTLFGDAIVPRGGRLALASLLDIMRAFRVSETLVRTAVSRLVAEGLFERRKIGRNTFYALSGPGQGSFAVAAEKIYGLLPRNGDGRFDLVLLEGTASERAQARTEWQERGYGVLTPDLLMAVGRVEAAGGLRLRAEACDHDTAQRLAARAWPLEDLSGRYRHFNAMFEPARAALERAGCPGDLPGLVIRILLIHEYRRVILRDPLLPAEFLPQDWPGDAAHDLCAAIYAEVADPADRWLGAHATNEQGALPGPSRPMSLRFARRPS